MDFREIIVTFTYLLPYMVLRYNKVLKLIAILIFSFELLAPAAFSSTLAEKQSVISDKTSFTTMSHSLDFLSHLIFEETGGEEEREAKHTLTTLCFTEVFSALQKFEATEVTWTLRIEHFDTRPSLFCLHRVLII